MYYIYISILLENYASADSEESEKEEKDRTEEYESKYRKIFTEIVLPNHIITRTNCPINSDRSRKMPTNKETNKKL